MFGVSAMPSGFRHPLHRKQGLGDAERERWPETAAVSAAAERLPMRDVDAPVHLGGVFAC
jgi:hypothetical protein